MKIKKEFKNRTKETNLNFLFSVLLCFFLFVFAFAPYNTSTKATTDATKTDDTTSYVMVDEIWNESTGQFDGNNLTTLLQYITGNSSITSLDVTSRGSIGQTKSAADIRTSTANGKTTSQDVQVTFGGLTWTVTYLSQDANGNDIVTLWLSNNYQQAWEGRSATEGALYGFINGALYSDWSNDLRNDYYTVNYPTNMYGTSYINAVTLNNGGSYVTSVSGTSSTSTATLTSNVGQNSNSVFAIYTMDSVAGSVTDYLVKPNEVSWQETENAYAQGCSYTYGNDAWGTPAGSTKWYSESYGSAEDMVDNLYYDAWANSYIWLPSMAEAGNGGDGTGLWEVSSYQRANNSGSTNFIRASVGSNNTSNATYVYDYSWLRSGYCNKANYAYDLHASGFGYDNNYVDSSYAVRPALHLNLNSAALTTDPTIWNGSKIEAPTLQNPAQANSEDNPYIIDSAAKLAWVSANYLGQANGAYFLQTEDLNLNNHAWTPINRGHNAFYHYDGGNHTISGINVENPSTSFENFAGLFGSMRGTSTDHGYIKNLGLISGTVTGKQNVSALLAYGEYVDIENCYNNGVLVTSTNSPSNAGGLVGGGVNVTITNSFNTANITGQDSVGGIAGSVTNSTVSSCYNTGDISATYRSGGLVGAMIGGSIDNTYNTGSISATSYAGGIAGNLLGTSTLPTASVSSSYNIGEITGGNSGGIIGSTYCSGATSLTATDCYFNSDTTSLTLGIGQGTSSGTTALTTAQMQGTSPSMNLSGSYWTFTAGQYPTLTNVVQAETSSGGNWSVGTGSVA